MAYHTIKLKKQQGDVIEEKIAAGVITPGNILELDSNGKVQRHSTSGATVAPLMVALEDELQGKTIDDNYAADDPVQVWYPKSGDIFYGLLDATSEDVSIPDGLESNGDGTLKKWTPLDSEASGHERSLVGRAEEAVTEVGSAASTDARIRVKVV